MKKNKYVIDFSPCEGDMNGIDYHCNYFDEVDDCFYDCGNYFKTAEDARKEFEKMKIKTKLQMLADRLNEKDPVNWKNVNQPKYLIRLNPSRSELEVDFLYTFRFQGPIYSTDKNFLDIAINEIGEDNLKKLFI